MSFAILRGVSAADMYVTPHELNEELEEYWGILNGKIDRENLDDLLINDRLKLDDFATQRVYTSLLTTNRAVTFPDSFAGVHVDTPIPDASGAPWSLQVQATDRNPPCAWQIEFSGTFTHTDGLSTGTTVYVSLWFDGIPVVRGGGRDGFGTASETGETSYALRTVVPTGAGAHLIEAKFAIGDLPGSADTVVTWKERTLFARAMRR